MILFNEAKPKYDKLDELVESPILENIRFSNKVNMIIDLKEIIRKYYRPDIDMTNINRKALIEELSSDMINTIGHWRNYFAKKGKKTKFYILYSFEKCSEIISELNDYKKDYYNEFLNPENERYSPINSAAKILFEISKVIPGSKMVDTSKTDEFVYAKFICTKLPTNEATIILSNDDVFYQLINDNTFVISIKGIKSELFDKDSVIEKITGKDIKLSVNVLPMILSLTGTKRYSYRSVPGVALIKATNIVSKLLEREKMVDTDSMEVPIDFDKLSEKDKLEKLLIDNKDQIIENYKFIRADEIMFKNKLLLLTDLVSDRKQGTANYFLQLNEKFFVRYPLNIDMLLNGCYEERK